MKLRTVGLSLAGVSFALGLAELAAAKRTARWLGVPSASNWVRAFGVRELAAGAALVRKPTASRNAFGRAAGDLIDLAALGVALNTQGAKRRPIAGAAAFVGAALIADTLAALAMKRAEKR